MSKKATARALGRGGRYYAATRTAKFSVYVKGRKGKVRVRRTARDVSFEEAEKLLVEMRAKANRNSVAANIAAPTLREFVAAYWDDIAEGLSEKTSKEYRCALDAHILPTFGDDRLTDITAGRVNLWARRLKKQGYNKNGKRREYSGASLNGYANIVRLVVNYAVRFDVLEESPFKKPLERHHVDLPENELSDDARQRFLRAFTDREAFVAQLSAAQKHGALALLRGGAGATDDAAIEVLWQRHAFLRPFFVLALETGLRLGDQCCMEWKDVDRTTGWITLRMEKTKKPVMVPITNACAAALAELARRPVIGARVFVDEEGTPLSVTRIRRAFACAKRLAGIKVLRLHDLRHTLGSRLASEGLPTAAISKWLGHANERTTKRYARPDTRVLEVARAALNKNAGR